MKRFDLIDAPPSFKADGNISPFSQIPVILNESPRILSFIRWGFVPSWFKEDKAKNGIINARAETIAQKPAFKMAFKSRRCLIPADAFFEWQKTNGRKRLFRFMLKDEGVFSFAGIWDVWKWQDREIQSCAIITTTPNELIRDIHDRMPVILSAENERRWLSGVPSDEARGILKPFDADFMRVDEIPSRTGVSAKADLQLF